MASTTFSYTGGSQSFVVPTGVTSLTVECWGAQGGAGMSTAGLGGYLKSTQTVTPGETLDSEGGRSGNTGGTDTASYNGGGRSYGGGYAGNLMGGGASDVRRGGSALANRIAVAGGRGGAEAVRVASAAVVRRVAERRVAGMVYPLGVEAPNQRVVVPRVMEVLGH